MARARDQDACPGALQLHQAADGALARVRLPGGMIAPRQLEALAHAATRFGSPAMELTSRGNIQIRGIRDDEGGAALADAVAAAGLLPSPTHERVRNIVASPLSGRLGGSADVRDWVRRLDAAICAEPALADLPGRFWFSIDDGRGDVSGLGADVGAHALGDTVALAVGGPRHRRADRAAGRGGHADIDRETIRRDPGKRLARSRTRRLSTADSRPCPVRRAGRGPGRPLRVRRWAGSTQDDGRIALGGAVPLGVLQARVAEYLAAVDAPIVVTPWRSVLVCDLDEGVADAALRVLAPMGLVFDDELTVARRQRLHRQPRLRTLRRRRPRRRRPRRRGRRLPFIGTSSDANGPAAAHPTARC